MITLIYDSATYETCSTMDLPLFLSTIRESNMRLNITGMLLYHNGNLMQIIEGEEEAVHAIFEKIKIDKRHFDVSKLIEFKITNRCYSDWTMAFKKLSETNWSTVKGFLNLEDNQIGTPASSSKSTYLKMLIDSFVDENKILNNDVVTMADTLKVVTPLQAKVKELSPKSFLNQHIKRTY